MTVGGDRFGGPVEVELLAAIALAENPASLHDDDGVGHRQLLVGEHLFDHGVQFVLMLRHTPGPLVRGPRDIGWLGREARLY